MTETENPNQLPKPDGSVNSGVRYDSARCPKGFRFLSNQPTDPDRDSNKRLQRYKSQPQKYIIFEEAYTADGQQLPDNVSIFEKIEVN